LAEFLASVRFAIADLLRRIGASPRPIVALAVEGRLRGSQVRR
jgi:hypothetical protein